MNEICTVLDDLRRAPGVKGAILLTDDGMTVASSLSEEFLDDVVAGLCSFLVTTTRRSLREAGHGKRFTRFVLSATHGKVVVIDLEQAFLVVITNQFANLQTSFVRLQEAAQDLRRLARIAI